MPTIKGIPGPYRFHFYSFDCNEPKHVHAEREDATCKFWLDPLVLADNHGFSARDLAPDPGDRPSTPSTDQRGLE